MPIASKSIASCAHNAHLIVLACVLWVGRADAQPAVPAPNVADAAVNGPAPNTGESPVGDAGVTPGDSGPVPGAPGLVAPVLIEPAALTYPEGVDPAALPPAVVLRLTIDAAGSVREVEVVESAGPALDAAARDAMLRSRFSPARRDGVAIAARILYRQSFEPPLMAAVSPAAEPPPAATPAATPAANTRPQLVTVRGRRTEQERLAESAEAVSVVDMRRARRESSALGEVLARQPGVSLRKAGGLGSEERLSLNGLSDDRVATFLDGVPLELAFFPFGLGSFPVSLADRIEIYKGVVPVRFGVDALGGAVNLVTDRRYETGAGGSLELGSFGTQRATVDGAYRHEETGFVVNALGFYDHADNDYDVDVEVPDDRGRLRAARVPRFHDAYRAYGGTIEAGVLDRPWARRLLLRGYAVKLDKQLQHNTIMTVPYGEVRYGQSAVGVTGRYEVDVTPELTLELISAYSYRTTDFVDRAEWVYDWFGDQVRERRPPGEIDGFATDQSFWWHHVLGRLALSYDVSPAHSLTFVSSPTFIKLAGDERIQADAEARDPLTARRERAAVVSGLEYEANLFAMPARSDKARDPDEAGTSADYRLQNLLFIKHYLYLMSGQEPVAGGGLRDRELERHRFGIGDGVRLRIVRELQLKLSYEFATRLPRADEVFGDGVLVHDNLLLAPELSHNLNFGPQLELRHTPFGELRLEVAGFWRSADRLIVLLGNARHFTYQNVYAARSVGVEGLVNWTSPGKYVTLDATATFQDFRNASSQGTFGAFEGDRIPNRPWLFASWATRLHFEHVVLARDEFEPFYVGRFVNEYFRGWESQGLREFKQTLDAQVVHGVGITYMIRAGLGTYSVSVELQNLANSRTFDFFGEQKPGRALFVKVAGDLH